MRSLFTAVGAVLALLEPTVASAQPAPATVPPLFLVVRVDPSFTRLPTAEVQAVLLARLQPLVRGREVSASLRITVDINTCVEPCLGQAAARSGGIGVLVADLKRSPPSHRAIPNILSLRMLEPVTGAQRGEPVSTILSATTMDALAAALDALLPSLVPLLPPPPPRTTLLIAANTDGAAVVMDGAQVGITPLAPLAVQPGRHVVQASRTNYRTAGSVVELAPGESARVNLELALDVAATRHARTRSTGTQTATASRAATPWYFRWYVLGGAGVAVAGAVVAVVVLSSSSSDGGFSGVPVPPIE